MSMLPAIIEGGEKALAKSSGSALSKVLTTGAENAVKNIATKTGTDVATKALRNGWNGANDIEGMLNGKFLNINDDYFPNTFSSGALGRIDYSGRKYDQNKVAGLVRAIRNNEDIAPIAGFRNKDGYIDIYDGHHRLAAYKKAGKMPRVKIFDPSDKASAYSYADDWVKNNIKKVEKFLPAKETNIDNLGMGYVDLKNLLDK